MEFIRVGHWLALLAVLGGAGLPVAARLFARVDGRGAGFALPVALVILTTVAYWVGQLSYAVAPAVGFLALAVASLAAWLDWPRLRREGMASIREDSLDGLRADPPVAVSVDRRAVGEVAAVFLVAFLFLVTVRAFDPAVHAAGGEKFLDFGLLKSLARAETLPPEDMWFAGESVRYYYGGHLIASLLARLSGTPPAVAYNLALATFYAALVAGAYDLAGAVGVERGVPRRVAGAFAAFLVGVASNLFTPVRLVLAAFPSGLARSLTGGSEVLTPLARPTDFSYWTASRVIEGTINEFPLFAWVNGDLHAHMMGTPFLLLAAGLAYSYVRTPDADRRRRRLLVFAAVPAVAGLQAVIDTWSFPSVFGLTFLALALGPADPSTLLPAAVTRRGRGLLGVDADALVGRGSGSLRVEGVRLLAAGAVVGVAGVLGVALAAPFLLGAAGGREVAVLAASARSGLGGLLLVHGGFVAVFVAFLLARLRPSRRGGLAMLAAVVLLGWVAVAVGAPVLLVALPLLAAGWVALRLDRPVGFETLLIVAGAGLVTIVEFLYVKEQAGPLRMNTVFKTYMQVWVLWGVAGGVALPGLLASPTADARRSLRGTAEAVGGARERLAGWPDTGGVRGPVASALVVALVLSTSVYGAFALAEHAAAADDPATLDATAFVERDHPEYAQAIDHVDSFEGTPTMVAAPGTARCLNLDREAPCPPGMYTWNANPASSLTGVPTVAGWAHEIGYRGEAAYVERASDVDTIYTGTPAQRAALLRAYDVEYVWVGGTERLRYGEVSFRNTPGVERSFHAGAVTIYRVEGSELPE
jgi:YYY domain-containing protein